ncbi:MAG: NAD(P)/FAD-dependent oxidoreductase [Candidatus Bathyarchaeia archaeon]
MGAGPAGSVCAQVLGEAGVNVALFDPSHPREKPCGGLIDYRIVEEFDIPEELLENEVKWILAERFGFKVRLSLKPPAHLVSRKNFDYYLLQKALKNRSLTFFRERVINIVKDENGWKLKTDKDRLVKVKILVGADGCPSLIRRHVLGLIPKVFLATTVGYNFTCPNRYIERAFAKNTVEAYYSHKYVQKMGFIWIFPKKSSVNIGIGSMESGKKLRRSLESFIASNPAGKRLKNFKGELFGHLIPIIWEEKFYNLPCCGENWALIGDAAGHVDPIGGVGIYYAMRGGALCASAILNGDVKLFEKYWRSDYGYELCYRARNFPKFYGKLALFTWFKTILENIPLQLGLLHE